GGGYYGGGTGYGSDPYGGGYGTMPGYGTTPGYGQTQQPLIAKVDEQKNGTIFGIGTFRATVTVMNPSSAPQSGTLKVSILDNGRSIKDFTERISVPAGQSITRTYEDTRW